MKITIHLHIFSNMVAELHASAALPFVPLDGGCPDTAAQAASNRFQKLEAHEQQAASAREFIIKVEDELRKFRRGILAVMDKNFFSSATTGESKMSHYTEDGHVAYAEATKITEESIDKDVPVVLQRQVPVIQQVQKTVEIPQVQHTGKIIDVSVATQRGVPTMQAVQKTVDVPQVRFLDPVVDIPVSMQRQAPRVVEETIDVPISRAKEEILEAVRPIPQGHAQNDRRVSIMDDCDELIPGRMNVVKGVVDSGDLSLDISRETPLQNEFSCVIEKNHVKKVLDRFAEIAELKDDRKKSYEQRGKCSNFGVHDDSTVGAKIAEPEVPQAQFINMDVSVDMQRQVSAVQVVKKTAEVPEIRFIDRVVDPSVVQQRQVPTVQTIREAVETSQAQFRDKVDDMPVVVQRKVPMIQRAQKTVEVPKIQYVDKIVDAPIAAAQQPVPVDAESLWVEEVSVGTQTVSRKMKLWLETESAESADGTSDTEHGLVQGEESRREMDETRERHAAGEDLDLLPVAPNMEAGGSHLQAMTGEERIEVWTQDLREIRRMVEFLVHRERKLDVKADVAIRRLERLEKEDLQRGGRSARSQPSGSPRRQDQGR